MGSVMRAVLCLGRASVGHGSQQQSKIIKGRFHHGSECTKAALRKHFLIQSYEAGLWLVWTLLKTLQPLPPCSAEIWLAKVG